jgi:hypothetical protein
MELEDLKTVWHQAEDWKPTSSENQQDILLMIHKSRKGIRKMFTIELGISIVLYAAFLMLVIFMRSSIQSFMYKLVGTITLFAVPMYWRFFLSVKHLNNVDYGQDIRTNVVKFVIHYKTTIASFKCNFSLGAIFPPKYESCVFHWL